jgi:hypothetical protein
MDRGAFFLAAAAVHHDRPVLRAKRENLPGSGRIGGKAAESG